MLHWLIALAIIYGLILVVSSLSGVPLPKEVTDYGNAIPNWLQGIGTAAAAYLAWLAWTQWRRPDDAKRKAESAQEIMRVSGRFETAVIASRTAQAVFSTDGALTSDEDLIPTMKLAVDEKSDEKIKAAHELANSLRVLIPEAEVMLGRTLAQQMQEMVQFYERVNMAYLLAPHFYNGFVFPDRTKRNETLKDTLRTLGIRSVIEHGEFDDPFETEVKASGQSLRTKLARFLVTEPMQ